jgi:hypothetical protein
MEATPGDHAAAARIDRLFRRSALVREKWTGRANYRERTIARAIRLEADRAAERDDFTNKILAIFDEKDGAP